MGEYHLRHQYLMGRSWCQNRHLTASIGSTSQGNPLRSNPESITHCTCEHESLSHHLLRWLHTFPQYRIAGTNTRTQPASLGDNSLQLKPLFFSNFFSKQGIICVWNSGWNSTASPEKRTGRFIVSHKGFLRCIDSASNPQLSRGWKGLLAKFSHRKIKRRESGA